MIYYDPALFTKPVTLEGRHVRLEPLTLAHVPGLAAVGCDERIWKLMLYGDIRTEADMRAWVEGLLHFQEQGTDLPFTVIFKRTGKVVGATRYMDMRPTHRGLEIGGTWYTVKYQRTAVNTECKYLLLQYAFETLGCIRVQFKADIRNERSWRAIERIGGVREGILRNHYILQDGTFRDSVYYSILDREWPGVRVKLTKMLER
jgi:RimJ/RimL family protein N-acetyltransferase